MAKHTGAVEQQPQRMVEEMLRRALGTHAGLEVHTHGFDAVKARADAWLRGQKLPWQLKRLDLIPGGYELEVEPCKLPPEARPRKHPLIKHNKSLKQSRVLVYYEGFSCEDSRFFLLPKEITTLDEAIAVITDHQSREDVEAHLANRTRELVEKLELFLVTGRAEIDTQEWFRQNEQRQADRKKQEEAEKERELLRRLQAKHPDIARTVREETEVPQFGPGGD